jgi:hypothetical protein
VLLRLRSFKQFTTQISRREALGVMAAICAALTLSSAATAQPSRRACQQHFLLPKYAPTSFSPSELHGTSWPRFRPYY